MKSKINIIIGREYMERVSKKSFILTTFLMPILMIGLMLAPALITIFNTPESRKIAVIDDSGIIAPMLQNSEEVEFVNTASTLDAAKADESIEGILVIGENVMTSPSDVSLYTRDASSMVLEQVVATQINMSIEQIRLAEVQKVHNIDNLPEIIGGIHSNVVLQTFRIDEESEQSSSSGLAFAIGMIMTMLLYIFLLLYGQLVMTSIIEEKNNRVLEIVVSSVKPAQLMMGKILGIGAVAVTQVLIWAALITAISAYALPAMLPADVMSEVSLLSSGQLSAADATNDIGLLQAIMQLGDVSYILMLFGYLLLFLIGGFLFFAAIYAAIGSAVDNIQDAGQLQSVVIVPIILGLIFSMSVVNEPNSTLATVLSMVPFTSPMVMMARIPFGIPTWEIITSLLVLYVSFLFMVWVSAKIYRVGIFMYGKKPSIKELLKWINYK